MDYGAMNAIEENAGGIIKGLIGQFADYKNRKAQREETDYNRGLMERKMNLDESEKGMEWNPEENKYNFTEQKKAQIEAANQKVQQEMALKERDFGLKDRGLDLKEKEIASKQSQGLLGNQLNQAKLAKLNRELSIAPRTGLQKKMDQDLGKELADWTNRGQNSTKANLQGLDEALKMLNEKDTLSKKAYGFMPESLINVTNPRALQVKRLANQVSVQNMRDTFGPQFTEREGQLFMGLDYDPKADEATNISNLQRKRQMIQDAFDKKNQLLETANAGGSVSGPKYPSAQSPGLIGSQSGTSGLSSDEAAELAELKAKQAGRVYAK